MSIDCSLVMDLELYNSGTGQSTSQDAGLTQYIGVAVVQNDLLPGESPIIDNSINKIRCLFKKYNYNETIQLTLYYSLTNNVSAANVFGTTYVDLSLYTPFIEKFWVEFDGPELFMTNLSVVSNYYYYFWVVISDSGSLPTSTILLDAVLNSSLSSTFPPKTYGINFLGTGGTTALLPQFQFLYCVEIPPEPPIPPVDRCQPKPFYLLLNSHTNHKQISSKRHIANLLKRNRSLG